LGWKRWGRGWLAAMHQQLFMSPYTIQNEV